MRPGPRPVRGAAARRSGCCGPQTRKPGRRGDLANWTGQAGDAAGARDQYAALLPVRAGTWPRSTRRTLAVRSNLAYWTGQRGMRPGPATSTPRCCPSASGSRRRTPGHLGHPLNLALDRAGRRRGRGPRPVRGAAARRRNGSWPRRPLDPDRPRQPRLLDRAGRRRGRRPRPVRRAAARRERVLGADTRTRWDPLPPRRLTGLAGDPAGARDQYAAPLPPRERVLGLEPPQTPVARCSLADWTGQAGDAAAARDQYAALLPLEERVARHAAPADPDRPRQQGST